MLSETSLMNFQIVLRLLRSRCTHSRTRERRAPIRPDMLIGLIVVCAASSLVRSIVQRPLQQSSSPSLPIHGSARTAVQMAEKATHVFSPLNTPANYTEMLANAAPDAYSVIKWQAPYCRSCKQPSSLMDQLADELPSATFYSMDLIQDGKAAGKRMLKFFKVRVESSSSQCGCWL